MPEHMTEERLREIEARRAEALGIEISHRDSISDINDEEVDVVWVEGAGTTEDGDYTYLRVPDGLFIEACYTDVPDLCAEVRRARREIDELSEIIRQHEERGSDVD